LEDDMVLVFLESIQMEIPVFEMDLERVGDLNENSSMKAKLVPGKQEKKEILPPLIVPDLQYEVLRSLGIQLAFDPVLKKNGLPEKYEIYILNDTKFDTIYNIVFYLNEEKEETWSGTIAAMSHVKLDELFYDELNDFPILEAECWKVSTEGKGERQFKTLKIKPKIFFKNVRTVPFLNKKVHWYLLFENFDSQPVRKEIDLEDLLNYTKNNARPSPRKYVNRQKYNYTSPTEYAEFIPVIDLHVQNLSSNYGKMTNAQIMQLQLQKFEEFIAKAVRLGVPQVFVIHGLGKGRLRDEIAIRLKQNSCVEKFKNEHHPKYGWGATEVIL
jgi:hypothetical protein